LLPVPEHTARWRSGDWIFWRGAGRAAIEQSGLNSSISKYFDIPPCG
jgi:hypothetical protein